MLGRSYILRMTPIPWTCPSKKDETKGCCKPFKIYIDHEAKRRRRIFTPSLQEYGWGSYTYLKVHSHLMLSQCGVKI
jgi:hypothetical protein